MEWHQYFEDTWIAEDNGVRFFLLIGTKKALLIDSGMMVHNARDLAKEKTDLPLELLNTHADMDHVGSNVQFEAFYMHPSEEENYRRGGREGRLIPINEGDRLDLGERVLEIIHLPGHTPGSIAVVDTKHRVLISGDPIQENGRIFMFGPQRNMRDYIVSLGALEKHFDAFDEIWPSHGKLPVGKETVALLRKGAQDVLDGKVQGEATEMHGHSIVAYDVGVSVLLCDA